MSSKFKKITIIAYLKHYESNGNYFSYEPYVREMIYWSQLFDEIILYTEVRKDTPAFSLKVLPSNIKVRKLFFNSGSGLKNNFLRLFQMPILFAQICFAYVNSEIIHTRSSGLPTMFVNLLNLVFNKVTLEKWATNAPPDAKLGFLTKMNFKLLLLSPTKTRVFTYTKVNHPSFVLAFPALLSNVEINNMVQNSSIAKWDVDFHFRSFVCVSRLHPDKNLDLIFSAISSSKKNSTLNKNFKLFIVGDGPFKDRYEDLIDKNGLKGVIILLGKLSFTDTLNEISKHHFLIMPGINEGWPKVINEALICKTVPLVVKGGSAEKIMERMEKPGLLFDNDLNSLINSINNTYELENSEIRELIDIGLTETKKLTLERYIELVKETYNDIK